MKWEAVGRTVMKQCGRPNALLLKLAQCWMHLLAMLAMAVKSWCGVISLTPNRKPLSQVSLGQEAEGIKVMAVA